MITINYYGNQNVNTMSTISEFEPVEVIVYFAGLSANIIKFKWRGAIYKVTEMLQSWKIPVREGYEYHYVVTCRDSDLLCELSFSNLDFRWLLVRYDSID
jgi:hypothetical protein